MRSIERFTDLRRSWHPSHALLVIPLALIVIIAVVDILSSTEVHLGPLLVVAPALTASFAGPRRTAVIGTLALLAEVLDGLEERTLTHHDQQMEMLALLTVSAFVVLFCAIRERREALLAQVRSVSEATQGVVLRPLPRRCGPLRIASVYLAAAAEAEIGGDLYAAARAQNRTRLIIGDVRGKGLASISEAAVLLCAFREASHRQSPLPMLVRRLEASVCHNLAELAETNPEAAERFVTAAIVDVPDGKPEIQVVDCGHPPPLLLRKDRVLTLQPDHTEPPLGLGGLTKSDHRPTTFGFEPGDVLLLYTDGVLEARDHTGMFYDLPERLRARAGDDIDTLVQELRDDLLDHAGGRLDDDAAMIAIERLPASAEDNDTITGVHCHQNGSMRR